MKMKTKRSPSCDTFERKTWWICSATSWARLVNFSHQTINTSISVIPALQIRKSIP